MNNLIQIFRDWDKNGKWPTYNSVFFLMDKRKVTLSQIIAAAYEGAGISEDTIRMRRRDYLKSFGRRDYLADLDITQDSFSGDQPLNKLLRNIVFREKLYKMREIWNGNMADGK